MLEDAATNDVAALATRLGGKQTNVAISGINTNLDEKEDLEWAEDMDDDDR